LYEVVGQKNGQVAHIAEDDFGIVGTDCRDEFFVDMRAAAKSEYWHSSPMRRLDAGGAVFDYDAPPGIGPQRPCREQEQVRSGLSDMYQVGAENVRPELVQHSSFAKRYMNAW